MESELVWLAGWLEGEGSFTVYTQAGRTRPQVQVQASSTDRDVVEHAARVMGVKVHGPYAPSCSNFLAKKQRYMVKLYGKPAQDLCEQLLPLMGERRSARIKELLAIPVATFPNLSRDSRTGRMIPVIPHFELAMMA
jgi:hypothetical protein